MIEVGDGLDRKLRKSTIGGPKGADQGPSITGRTCAKRQTPEKYGGEARRCPTGGDDQRLRECPIAWS